MKKPPPSADATESAADATSPPSAPKTQIEPSSSPGKDKGTTDEPPLSKNQLKKRRRWEKAQAVKRRRKEQSREVRRLKAAKEGRDLAAERRQQLQNEKEGKGWKKREEKWKEIMAKADVENSFRVCVDCTFEEDMSRKERNSLGLQLRYVYATNRRSSMPVYVDVCGLKKGGETRAHLEKVEGFPERWVGRAYHCWEAGLEEVYANGADEDGGQKGEGVENGAGVLANDKSASDALAADGTNDNAKDVADDNKSDVKATNGTNEGAESGADATENNESDAQTADDPNNNSNSNADDDKSDVVATDGTKFSNNAADDNESGEPPYPKLRPDHQFVYLTGDSPNTLTSLDNNTTYIIGGIVDRNRLKRAAIDRAESIAAKNPSLKVKTARLPLDENVDFKGSTRILTCNHVFEILQRFRENGDRDWKGSIMAVLPCRKDLEGREEEEDAAEGGEGAGTDEGKKDDSVNGNKDFVSL
eukprot:CAMPEP_0172544150 /NCGR_PEP_ID=MMETSP1067-20121228/14364_1 /TAXON_ID=265564 ORGANISM="Thalassiosira punctigera, Strain Tpunct2005C2" /NCGR_SAMPLE_ID=MMETSP1067 /ASSEMBLY_ACC=CAM_ASM_000444 /LENGTH=474 /DNA_ID=CAMNT_0013330663 /DNA_START=21 /DNA_END=1445 /DNA_ORIENTATION=-